MCEHGEMAPVLNRLEFQCIGYDKMNPHLMTHQMMRTNRGFVRPEATPRDLGLKGDDNPEMVVHLLPLRIMYAHVWPERYRGGTYRRHFDYRHTDRHNLFPIESTLSTSPSVTESDSDDSPLLYAASSSSKARKRKLSAKVARKNKGIARVA